MEEVFSTIERIKKALGAKNDSQAVEMLGYSAGTISSWKSRGKVPMKSLGKISQMTGVSIDWLISGEGAGPGEPTKEPTDGIQIDVYTLAGAGEAKELTDYEPIETVIAPARFKKPSIYPVKVRGKSMECTISDGAIVGVDSADKQVVSGEIYAVWLPYEGAVIKRLYIEPDRIVLRSDNKGFEDFSVSHDKMQDGFVLGRVKWVIQEFR